MELFTLNETPFFLLTLLFYSTHCQLPCFFFGFFTYRRLLLHSACTLTRRQDSSIKKIPLQFTVLCFASKLSTLRHCLHCSGFSSHSQMVLVFNGKVHLIRSRYAVDLFSLLLCVFYGERTSHIFIFFAACRIKWIGCNIASSRCVGNFHTFIREKFDCVCVMEKVSSNEISDRTTEFL